MTPCTTCNGKRVVHDPPLEQQEKEADEGKRVWLTFKLCPVCNPAPPSSPQNI